METKAFVELTDEEMLLVDGGDGFDMKAGILAIGGVVAPELFVPAGIIIGAVNIVGSIPGEDSTTPVRGRDYY